MKDRYESIYWEKIKSADIIFCGLIKNMNNWAVAGQG